MDEPTVQNGAAGERIVIIPGMVIRLPPATLVDHLRTLGFSMQAHPSRPIKQLGTAFVNAAPALAEIIIDATPEQREALYQLGFPRG